MKYLDTPWITEKTSDIVSKDVLLSPDIDAPIDGVQLRGVLNGVASGLWMPKLLTREVLSEIMEQELPSVQDATTDFVKEKIERRVDFHNDVIDMEYVVTAENVRRYYSDEGELDFEPWQARQVLKDPNVQKNDELFVESRLKCFFRNGMKYTQVDAQGNGIHSRILLCVRNEVDLRRPIVRVDLQAPQYQDVATVRRQQKISIKEWFAKFKKEPTVFK